MLNDTSYVFVSITKRYRSISTLAEPTNSTGNSSKYVYIRNGGANTLKMKNRQKIAKLRYNFPGKIVLKKTVVFKRFFKSEYQNKENRSQGNIVESPSFVAQVGTSHDQYLTPVS